MPDPSSATARTTERTPKILREKDPGTALVLSTPIENIADHSSCKTQRLKLY